MTRRSAELRVIDARMDALKARREMILVRERADSLAADLKACQDRLRAELSRTTPDSAAAMSDLSLTNKLRQAQEENLALREAAKRHQPDVQRLHEAQRAIEQMRTSHQEEIDRFGRTLTNERNVAREQATKAERARIVALLRRWADETEKLRALTIGTQWPQDEASAMRGAATSIERG
jgi:hypothetical protein